ncbi:fungal-specific transcription factor domain-containing protein [Cercophora newfieldiana]|uniref:Fungal-specific transcription factor domain-containing protein n=1 Tax=Cercophora newfieldiana TaxID=92897 RepID=A0AA39Y1S5_9PEZI|nr:fungal-specific transcription factor domain-containing protein [Cercophora newfieldiana]
MMDLEEIDAGDDAGPMEQSGYHSPTGHSRTASKSGRLACDICRERKVRCDRHWPKCGRCARLGDNCSYTGRARYRQTQADLPRQVKQLQERLFQAEAKLSAQERPVPATTPTSELEIFPTNNRIDRDDQWPAISRTFAGEQRVGRDEPSHGSGGMAMGSNMAFDFDTCDFLCHSSNYPFNHAQRHQSIGWLSNASGMMDFTADEGPASNFTNELSSLESHLTAAGTATDTGMSSTAAAPSERASAGSRAGQGTGTQSLVSVPSSEGHQDGAPDEQMSSDQISPSELRELHNIYFDEFYSLMPILNKNHFFSHIQENSSAPQVRALSYAVALIGTMVSPGHKHLENACLAVVRTCAEECERDEDMLMMLSLDFFQALLFLVRFELTQRSILRAWVTLGRAVRLANMLGLHADNAGAGTRASSSDVDLDSRLPPASNPVCRERRIRSFWTLYICETYASHRAKLSPLLHEDQITIPLPSPGVLGADFSPCSTPTLADSYATHATTAFNPNDAAISPFAGIVLACSIARRCGQSLSHTEHPTPAPTPVTPTQPNPTQRPMSALDRGFWDKHFSLLTVLKQRSELLAPHLTVRAVQTDPVSFGLYVYLCGVDIALQETAVTQVQRQGLSPEVASDSARRSRAAAYRLVGVVRGTLPRDGSMSDFFVLHGAFMARPLAVAMQVLSRDLQLEHDADGRALSVVADSIQLLLGALDRVEEAGGFWHGTVAPVARALQEWEEIHGNRPADTWASIFHQV